MLKVIRESRPSFTPRQNTPTLTAVRLLELDAKHTKRVSKAGVILNTYKAYKVKLKAILVKWPKAQTNGKHHNVSGKPLFTLTISIVRVHN